MKLREREERRTPILVVPLCTTTVVPRFKLISLFADKSSANEANYWQQANCKHKQIFLQKAIL